MWVLNSNIFVVFFSACCIHSLHAATCKETERSHVKLELAKQCIKNAKAHLPHCRDETDESNCTAKDRSLAYLDAALDLIAEANMTCRTCPGDPKVIVLPDRPIDCYDILNKSISSPSGVYKIWPETRGVQSNKLIDVYCDMKTDGGGWTVIQRRGKFANQIDFYRDWKAYKNGFGDLQQEFWLGNDKMFVITNQRNYSVRFDLVDNKQEYRYACYKLFSIGNENSGYVLSIKDHSGNATEDMIAYNNGQKFSTKDKNSNAGSGGMYCSEMYQSAFWFPDRCGIVNLNGIYQPGVISQESIWWYQWKSSYEGLYSVEIKIRPNNV